MSEKKLPKIAKAVFTTKNERFLTVLKKIENYKFGQFEV